MDTEVFRLCTSGGSMRLDLANNYPHLKNTAPEFEAEFGPFFNSTDLLYLDLHFDPTSRIKKIAFWEHIRHQWDLKWEQDEQWPRCAQEILTCTMGMSLQARQNWDRLQMGCANLILAWEARARRLLQIPGRYSRGGSNVYYFSLVFHQ